MDTFSLFTTSQPWNLYPSQVRFDSSIFTGLNTEYCLLSGIVPSTLHPSGAFSSYVTVKLLDSIGVSVLLIFSFIPFISLVTSSLVLVLYKLKLSI